MYKQVIDNLFEQLVSGINILFFFFYHKIKTFSINIAIKIVNLSECGLRLKSAPWWKPHPIWFGSHREMGISYL